MDDGRRLRRRRRGRRRLPNEPNLYKNIYKGELNLVNEREWVREGESVPKPTLYRCLF